MNYNYEAVIFDMDGTITNTEHMWGKAGSILLERRGIIRDAATQKSLSQQMQGLALHKSCLILKEVANLPESVEELIAEKSNYVRELYLKDGVSLIQGFEQFHAKLIKYQLKTGIATNATPDGVALTNRLTNLQRFFGSHIYDVSHVNYKNKPDPALYLHAAEQLGVQPSKAIAIEDSAHGIRAAKCAGLFCIGINTSRRIEQLKEADCIVNGYDEINIEQLLGTASPAFRLKR
jgi:beta-phosphoglucomutase